MCQRLALSGFSGFMPALSGHVQGCACAGGGSVSCRCVFTKLHCRPCLLRGLHSFPGLQHHGSRVHMQPARRPSGPLLAGDHAHAPLFLVCVGTSLVCCFLSLLLRGDVCGVDFCFDQTWTMLLHVLLTARALCSLHCIRSAVHPVSFMSWCGMVSCSCCLAAALATSVAPQTALGTGLPSMSRPARRSLGAGSIACCSHRICRGPCCVRACRKDGSMSWYGAWITAVCSPCTGGRIGVDGQFQLEVVVGICRLTAPGTLPLCTLDCVQRACLDGPMVVCVVPMFSCLCWLLVTRRLA